MHALIEELKEAGEDLEFYPTTMEMCRAVESVLRGCNFNKQVSVLDIGAGNGIFFRQLRKASQDTDLRIGDCYAIEKARKLVESMESGVFVVGTDFHKQTLIDKKVDVVFSNPPYSEYEAWAVKIIEEANASLAVLVLPRRWQNSKAIAKAVARRKATADAVSGFELDEDGMPLPMQFGFKDRSLRISRALVQIVVVKLASFGGQPRTDPFEQWVDKHFFDGEEVEEREERADSPEKIQALCKGRNLVERLEELYTKELGAIAKSFRSIARIDRQLLIEVGVCRDDVVESLKAKYRGLKSLYWKELFDNLSEITDRLARATRGEMVSTLTSNMSVDFNAENAYAVVVWAIRQANLYIEKQMVDVFMWMADKDHIKAYKSNARLREDGMRFTKYGDASERSGKYALDYRLVAPARMFAREDDYWHDIDGADYLNDVLIVARNLGFASLETVHEVGLSSNRSRLENALKPPVKRGETYEFHFMDGGKKKVLMSCRSFANGNTHIKFDIGFMQALNVNVGRAMRWINTPKEAAEEMDMPLQKVEELFRSNMQLGVDNARLLAEAKA